MLPEYNIESLGPIYTKRQCQRCNDAYDSILIEISGVVWRWVAIPFWSDSIVFIDNRIASVIAELLQRWRWSLV